jgi:hypothetical protein
MKPPPQEMARRLIYILYEGWCEARAYPLDAQRIFDLADAMHNAPALLSNFTDGWLRCLREDLDRYHKKYPISPNYVGFLEPGVPDDSEWLWLGLPEESEPIE